MQTDIGKRIEEYISKLGMTHDRNNDPNVISPSSIMLGAKFILELPELREAIEALELYALSCREKYGQLYNMGPSAEDKNKIVYGQVFLGHEARQALSKLRALGIVK